MTDEKKEQWEDVATGEKPPVEPEGSGPEQADTPGEPEALGRAGYAERDPKTEMPRVPTVPETQDDPHTHGGAPDPDEEPPASH